jgi:GT2 family glycosyltransferase
VDLSVVIVSYNSGSELREALQSIATDAGGLAWEAIVVDNASQDDSADVVTAFGPPVRLIANRENRGFGRAVNQGVRAASAPLVLVMNPDCRLAAGATTALRAELEANPACAIAGPRILDPDGSVQGSARGDPDMLTGLFGRTGPLRRLLPWLGLSTRNVVSDRAGASSPAVVVDWLSGACMLVRRSAFDAVGGFDERYFMYWEDADLCRRLRARGLHVRYVPRAVAVHRVGQSSRTARESSIRAFHASAYLYYVTYVAPGRFSPKRLLARSLLAARQWWQLRAARQVELRHTETPRH